MEDDTHAMPMVCIGLGLVNQDCLRFFPQEEQWSHQWSVATSSILYSFSGWSTYCVIVSNWELESDGRWILCLSWQILWLRRRWMLCLSWQILWLRRRWMLWLSKRWILWLSRRSMLWLNRRWMLWL